MCTAAIRIASVANSGGVKPGGSWLTCSFFTPIMVSQAFSRHCGHSFGFYGLEEHVDKHWFRCMGWDTNSSSLYNANGGCNWRGTSGWEQKLPEQAYSACPELLNQHGNTRTVNFPLPEGRTCDRSRCTSGDIMARECSDTTETVALSALCSCCCCFSCGLSACFGWMHLCRPRGSGPLRQPQLPML